MTLPYALDPQLTAELAALPHTNGGGGLNP